ncbi:hypothetical protein HYALB_00007735 [Hymenoscyphus albidus]|uniref:Leucine-rich repeat-containing protein 40 n=1 Tax=Hymenoscyphus albidus TaxID=595503 RepID=A0A9N9PYH3_9HELO|nr:hypothetical protein HYALB_00007735 [Hymenoscyphus albidus]
MDQPPNTSRLSGLPRPSRLPAPSKLPVMRPALRAAASRDNLQQPPKQAIANPKLRSTPSREHLSATSTRPRIPSTPSRARDTLTVLPQDRNVSIGSVLHTPTQRLSRRTSHDTLYRKPSQTFFGEQQTTPVKNREDSAHESALLEESEEPDVDSTVRSRKAPRPSLAERTMETLQSIPSSPAVRRRGSSFYGTENPMRSLSSGISSRPGSSHQPDGAMHPPTRSFSRPGSSAGQPHSLMTDFRANTNTTKHPVSGFASARPLTGRLVKKPSNIQLHPQTPTTSSSKLPSPIFSVSPPARIPTPAKSPNDGAIKGRSVSARPLKPRASVNGLFRKPSMTTLDKSSNIDRIGFNSKKQSTFSNTSSEGASTTSRISTLTSATTTSVDNNDTAKSSSNALRDQIAKAKAAKRASAIKLTPVLTSREDEEIPVIPSATFDFGLSDDPFSQHMSEKGVKGLLRKRVDAARSDGRLNIAAMGFKEIPEEVMNMYSLEAAGGSWAEAVDLTKFVAADNEFERLGDDVFPDVDPRDMADDEDAKGNQFGGLETLDLHGNVLIELPIGLRRLEMLTSLNLSNNKLGNNCFEVISQLPSLRDLKLGGNELTGPLDERISGLTSLESLDLQRNALVSLPDGLAELVRLRVFNVKENKLTSLSFGALRNLPLTEILASKNKLSGVLIDIEIEELSKLQVLNVACNSLTRISEGDIALPSLHQLNCSSNRLSDLPELTSWVSLLTLAAEDNSISSIPDGFTTLPKLKYADFTGNNIKVLNDNIGAMDSLDAFRISGNPLREKKFVSMATDELKRTLKARMTPTPERESSNTLQAGGDSSFGSVPPPPLSPRSPSMNWPIKFGNVLDRSNTQSHSLNPVAVAHIATNHSIKTLELHHNLFKEIPSSIAFFAATLTSLNIAHNELNNDSFMKDDLDLPMLKELNISSNTLNSLQPLMQHLIAPQLEKLDFSFNRLTTFPVLRQHFPNLVSVFASNNTIRELAPENIKGLRILDCSSNEINSLNARIGLLGGPGGLERLDVSGNRFRVPKYTVLEKGTEATLAWLRDRIPGNETSNTDTD